MDHGDLVALHREHLAQRLGGVDVVLDDEDPQRSRPRRSHSGVLRRLACRDREGQPDRER